MRRVEIRGRVSVRDYSYGRNDNDVDDDNGDDDWLESAVEVSAFSQASSTGEFYRALNELQPFRDFTKPVETYGSCNFAGVHHPRLAWTATPWFSRNFSPCARNDLIRHQRSGDLPFNTRGIVIDLLRTWHDCECMRCISYRKIIRLPLKPRPAMME